MTNEPKGGIFIMSQEDQTLESALEHFDSLSFGDDEAPEETDLSPDDELEGDESDQEEESKGPPRTEDGRFASKEPTSEEPEALEEVEPEQDGEIERIPYVRGEDGIVVDENGDEIPPFSYRADGVDYEIPGSLYGEEGVLIPTDQVPQIAQLLAQGRAHAGSFRQVLAERDAYANQVAAERDSYKAQYQAVADQITKMVENEGAFEQFILNQRHNWDLIQKDAELARLQRLNEHASSVQYELARQEQERQLLPLMHQGLEETMLQLAQQAGYTQEDLPALQDTFQILSNDPSYLDRFFPVAREDDPVSGVKAGQRYNVNVNAVAEAMNVLLRHYVPTVQRGGGTAGTPAQKEAAKTVGAAKAKKNKAPPSVGAKGKATPGERRRSGIPENMRTPQGALEWLDSGGYNDL